MSGKARIPFIVGVFLATLSCAEPGTETWPAVEDAVETLLVEFEAAKDAKGRSPFLWGQWETGQSDGDSIPGELLKRLIEEAGVVLHSDDLGLQREAIGVLTIFEPREMGQDTLQLVANWIFPEADGGWHGLEYEFQYKCSRVRCKRYRYFLSSILN